MDVIKRSGAVQEYDPQKITGAMRKAFTSVDQACDEAALSGMLAQVERAIGDGVRTVEDIQDEVERALMAGGFYDAAKSYILYRQKRSELRAARLTLAGAVNAEGMEELLQGIQRDFPEEEYALTTLSGKFSGFLYCFRKRYVLILLQKLNAVSARSAGKTFKYLLFSGNDKTWMTVFMKGTETYIILSFSCQRNILLYDINDIKPS